MKKQGFAIVEGLILVVMIIVCIALIVPSLQTADIEKDKATSISNLKALVGTYIAGQLDRHPMPRSKGCCFWLALYVGDSADNERGLKIDNVYTSPGKASYLLSPADKYSLSFEEVQKAFQNAIENEKAGWDKLEGDYRLYTSYAGPSSGRSFTSKKGSGIVGCEGARNGKGFYPDGFCYVTNNMEAGFKTYEELATEYADDWTGKESEPNWNSGYLEPVTNIGEEEGGSGSVYENLKPRETAKQPEAKKTEDEVKNPNVTPDKPVDNGNDSQGTIKKGPADKIMTESDMKETLNPENEAPKPNNMIIVIAIVVGIPLLVVLIVIFMIKSNKKKQIRR